MTETYDRPATGGETARNVQAHLGRAAKSRGGQTRSWSFYFFFRILSEEEMKQTWERLEAVTKPGSDEAAWRTFELDIVRPSLLNAGLVDEKVRAARMAEARSLVALLKDPRVQALLKVESVAELLRSHPRALNALSANPDGLQIVLQHLPALATLFANPAALKALLSSEDAIAALLASDELTALLTTPQDLVDLLLDQQRLREFVTKHRPPGVPPVDAPAEACLNWLALLASSDKTAVLDTLGQLATRIQGPDGSKDGLPNPKAAQAFLREARGVMERLRTDYRGLFGETGAELLQMAVAGTRAPVLPKAILHELLRQGASAVLDNKPLDTVRSQFTEDEDRDPALEQRDRTPANVAFTFQGLKALKLDETTLGSFPDVFKGGMAARAQRLHDVGPNAPENWEGELGLPCIHGYFSGGWAIQPTERVSEAFWRRLRADVRAFNDPIYRRGRAIRFWVNLMFRALGLECVQIELGQDPYKVDYNTGKAQPLDHRKEHFGFRDGLSQPFVDLDLKLPPAGGGNASRAASWSPVAAGEIYLNELDEDGGAHLQPSHPALRLGSTYVVFRKLEQDVQGFRTFLSLQRPRDKRAQDLLAAQFLGRWENGTPLLLSPNKPRVAPVNAEAVLNDFRYERDDPFGQKCPLGAHIRRTNPRDIAGGAARRHRILRRGLSYGGPLLPDWSAGDGEPRGILFFAANARIELQFEVIQGDWINEGELLGQAGLGKCPLTGANSGRPSDTFLEAGAIAPIGGLPRFVTTRGGEYFFAPGILALKMMAARRQFKTEPGDVYCHGFSMGDAINRWVLDERRLKDAAPWMLLGVQRVLKIDDGNGALSVPDFPGKVAVVGKHKDVTDVLSNRRLPDGSGVEFSVHPYASAAHFITRGDNVLIGTDAAGPTLAQRERMFPALDRAWARLAERFGTTDGLVTHIREVARKRLASELRRAAGSHAIDLIGELAVPACYSVLSEIQGTPGPDWLSELVASYPFARQHVGDLPAEWLAVFRRESSTDPAQRTMQFWSAFLLADLIGNFAGRHELRTLAQQAGQELLNHIEALLIDARAARDAAPRWEPRSLLEAFVAIDAETGIQDLYGGAANPAWRHQYYKDVSLILLELAGSNLAVIPLTFGKVMQALLNMRIDVCTLLRQPDLDRQQLVLEAERLNPNVPIRMRRCEAKVDIGGEDIEKGEFVAAAIGIANLDADVFTEPMRFCPYANKRGAGAVPIRDPDDFLLFGVPGSNKYCWGADKVAMPVLIECLEAAARLQGLRRVAGADGEPQTLVGIAVGLKARFKRVARAAKP